MYICIRYVYLYIVLKFVCICTKQDPGTIIWQKSGLGEVQGLLRGVLGVGSKGLEVHRGSWQAGTRYGRRYIQL